MKYRLILLVIGILSYSKIHAQNELLHTGNTAYELLDFEKAVSSYSEYLKTHPEDPTALLRGADAYVHLNDMANAAAWYEKAMQLGISAEYFLQYGKVLMRLGDYEKAKQQFLAYSSADKTVGTNYSKMCDYAETRKGMSPLFEIINLPINSEVADYSPALFGNGLVYVSGRDDVSRSDAGEANAGKGVKNNYLFFSRLGDDETMTKPKFLRSWLRDNNGENEGPVSYSADGKWVAFVKNNFIDNYSVTSLIPPQTDIYIAKTDGNGDWETAELFPFSGSFSNHYPALSADGSTLFFASNRPGGQGGYDIYQSSKKNGIWTEPRNMGSSINKPGNEISPFLDESELYFSSDYQTGFGGYDVFKAEIEGNQWVISNMGTGVNSSHNDFGFIYRKATGQGFFVSDRTGGEDIYRAKKTVSSSWMSITVRDASTDKLLSNTVVDMSACGKGMFKTNEEGVLKIRITPGQECRVKILRQGYEDYDLKLNKPTILAGEALVTLFKKGEKYEGSVIDGMSNASLEAVRIRLVNQSENTRSETFTDERGVYSLALKPNSKYMITYSKTGYVDVTVKTGTKDGTDKSILGSLLLFPTSGTTVPSIADVPGTPSVPSVPSVPQTPAVMTTPEITTPSVPSVPTVTTDVPSEPQEVDASAGFSVQLMSLSVGNPKNPGGLSVLQGMVNRVYVKSDEKWKRYRVGVYLTRDEAERIKDYIRAVGFDRAYVVEEDNTGLIQDLNL